MARRKVVGRTVPSAAVVVELPLSAKEVLATLYHQIGSVDDPDAQEQQGA